jgi:predicted kinase
MDRQAALQAAADEVEAALPGVAPTTRRPVLVLLSGLPGTGKSYLARRLAPLLKATVVETDSVRMLLYPQPQYTAGENFWVYRVCHEVIGRLLRRGVSVIFDATNLRERHRQILYQMADALGANLVLVRTTAPERVVRSRLHQRAIQPDPEDHSRADTTVYYRMYDAEEPMRRPYLTVDTSQDLSLAINAILRLAHEDGQ